MIYPKLRVQSDELFNNQNLLLNFQVFQFKFNLSPLSGSWLLLLENGISFIWKLSPSSGNWDSVIWKLAPSSGNWDVLYLEAVSFLWKMGFSLESGFRKLQHAEIFV